MTRTCDSQLGGRVYNTVDISQHIRSICLVNGNENTVTGNRIINDKRRVVRLRIGLLILEKQSSQPKEGNAGTASHAHAQ